MARFGHAFISGAVWIGIAVGIGLFGSWMTKHDGYLSILGWLIAIVGYGFAFVSGYHLWRITSFQLKGMKMMQEDPEGFARSKREYDEAMRRVENDDSETRT